MAEIACVRAAPAGVELDDHSRSLERSAQNRGRGTALLDHVKSLRPDRLGLWVF
jgi:hypothetical protein